MVSGISNANGGYIEYVQNAQNDRFISFGNTSTNPSLEEDTVELSNSPYTKENKLKKNKGLINKIKHLFTGKDYYKTPDGVKITSDNDRGSVYVTPSGEIYVRGVENATIKGSRKANTIIVSESAVSEITGKGGKDTIVLNSTIANSINSGKGADSVIVYNSCVDKIEGGSGKDTILTEDSNITLIDGNSGKDTVVTNGGHVDKVITKINDNVEVNNNPLNENPNDEYSFE